MSRSLPASLLVLALSLGSQAQAEPPNIILFLVDDLGWMDTAVYGSRYYKTPNIDRLAAAGMLFTDAYAASPHCSPTRASILTGKYPARLGITSAAGAHLARPDGDSRFPKTAGKRMRWLVPASKRSLSAEEVTLAEVLRKRGYRTAHLGKWHLGPEPKHWPDKQGFDVVFHGAPDSGPPSYHSPYGFLHGNIANGPEGEYITDRLTDEALDFISANRDRPFMLQLSHFGVHGPWGYQERLLRRHASRQDPTGRQGNPAMAAMIQSVDKSLGRVVDRLKRLRLTKRTIIVFLSDNGGAMHTTMGPREMEPTSNLPLRGAKGLLYEGGVRVPLIVSWPGVVEDGSRSSEVVSSIDLYPTLLEAAGVDPRPGRVVDGQSLVPLLTGSGKLQREAVFNYFALAALRAPPGVTVRSGRWKLIRWFQTTPWFPDEFELYDLETDIGETNNLASRMPERVARLDTLIDGFLVEAEVLLPRPNPDYDPSLAALGGWIPQGVDVEVDSGVVRCRLAGGASAKWGGLGLFFLGHPSERRQTGRYRLEVRARAARDVEGKVKLRAPGKGGEVHNTWRFELAGGSQWQDVSFELPVERAPSVVGLTFRTGLVDVEIDSIRLEALAGRSGWPTFTKTIEWPFDAGDE